MKKFFAFLLTFAMLFSLAMPAVAAEPTITGNTDTPTVGDVSASFNPEIAFTGFTYISNEIYTYDESTNTYTVIIPPDDFGADAKFKVTGKNLEYLEKDNTLLIVKENHSIHGEYVFSLEYLLSSGFEVSWNGLRDGSWVEYQYSNDDGNTWSDPVRAEVKQSYYVTVNASENGSVTANEYAIAGETVTLNVSPAENYGLNELTVTDASGNPVTVENNSFTMPASAVTVSATFKYTGPHDITVNDSDNGTVAADLDTATAGTTVTLTVDPADDYRLATLTVNDGAVEVTKVDDTTYTFVMPDAEVTVNATFEKIPHTVTIEDSENGTVSADKLTVVAGETVTLTWEVDAAYRLSNIEIEAADGSEVTITDKGLTAWTFVMPSSAITVTATFEKIPVTSAEIVWGSMSFTYDDTIDETTNAEKGWSPDSAEGAATVTVKNTGDTTFTAQAAYASTTEEYGTFTGTFDPASSELTAGNSYTFTLKLNGKPNKAIPEGTKIGEVTITITEAAEG